MVLTMELSEYVQKGFQMLADPGSFDSNTFTLLLRAAFQSLLDAQADEAVLDHPDLKHIDPVVLKHCHTAAATYILEAGKQRADKSTLRYRIYLNIHLFSNSTFKIPISVF